MLTIELRLRIRLMSMLAVSASLAVAAPAAAQFRVAGFGTTAVDARAGWIKTATPPPGETDPSSIELFVMEDTPEPSQIAARVAFAGFGSQPPAVPPSYDFRSSATGSSGGSPRLILRFRSGGGELRPVNLFAGVWVHQDGTTDWDSYGGVCGFRPQISYAELLDCHPGESVTGVEIWNDGGWLHRGGFQVLVDNVTVGGETVSKQDIDVLRGGAIESPARINAKPTSGQVLVRLPRIDGVGDFQSLSQVVDIPVRSVVDASGGSLELSTEPDLSGNFESGQFSGGVFQILQPDRAADDGVTELRLRSTGLPSCPAGGAGAASLTRALYSDVRRRRRRRLDSRAGSAADPPAGGFRVRAQNSTTRAWDAKWDTLERCDGTLTRVARGRVLVRDLRRGRSKLLTAGKRYLAGSP